MKRILIVDDESIVRMDLAAMLEEQGYDVVGEAGNGEEAIERAIRLVPDLIMMDIKMPVMDGLKASTILSKKLDVPILLLTAYSQQTFVERAKVRTITGYLVKPIAESQLIPAVEMALHQGEIQRSLIEESASANRKLHERKQIEQAKGILMKHSGCSEEDAYAKMRRISMEKQVPLVKVAHHVLKKADRDK